jgi:uncharacterized protein (TIGR02118 family)
MANAKLVVIYKTPENKEAFDRHYFDVHVPLALKIPGLRWFTCSEKLTGSEVQNTYMIAELGFASMDALNDAMASAESKAAVDDLGKFAQAGVTTLVYETRALFEAQSASS